MVKNQQVSKGSASRKTILSLSLGLTSIGALAQQAETVAKPAEMVDALHAAFGKHPGARAVHAKGIILEGDFQPSAEAKSICKAPQFQNKRTTVTFRFSDFTGIPDIPDTIGASSPRGYAVKFQLPDGSSTDIVAHSFNGFPTATTDEFREFLLALSKSGPEAPHPSPIEEFLGSHPVAKAFVSSQKPLSVSYGTLSYFGVNAFEFTNSAGRSHYIRYQFIPVAGEQFLEAEQAKNVGPDYLSEEIRTRVQKGVIKFKLYAQIAESTDDIKNPSVAWPNYRKKVLLGIFTIKALAPNTPEEDKSLTFNPNNLPGGVKIADQMLADRAKAYPISVKGRQE